MKEKLFYVISMMIKCQIDVIFLYLSLNLAYE